jgi:hypothetical protein
MLIYFLAQNVEVTITANMTVTHFAISSDRFLKGNIANGATLHAGQCRAAISNLITQLF